MGALLKAHPEGEEVFATLQTAGSWPVDAPGGRFFAEWETHTPATREGKLMFFFQFLQVGARWEEASQSKFTVGRCRKCACPWVTSNEP